MSGHCSGTCPGTGAWLGSHWEHKSHFPHALHPGPLSSLLSSTLLLCTRRGKMIFCLKHFYFFLIYIFIPEGDQIVLEKRGWGS